MNRTSLALALCFIAAPAYSITATVSMTSVGPPATSGSTMRGAAASTGAGASSSSGASGAKAAPAAATVTKPASIISAPGVPPKATPTTSVRAGVAQSKQSVFMPGPAKSGAIAAERGSAGWTAVAKAGTAMHRASVEAVKANPGTLQVYGKKLIFDPQRVKVFGKDGKPADIYALRAGLKVRFTMDSTDPARRRVAVIYLD